MLLAQQKRDVTRHFYMLTYYTKNKDPNKKFTVVIVIPIDFPIYFHYTASDYQSAATIVLLLVIYDSDLSSYFSGSKLRTHGETNPTLEQRASVIEIIHVEEENAIALGSTYIAMMTLIATNIQHVRNKPLQVCVTTTDKSTTVQIITSSIKFIATATNNNTPTAVITSLLHQLLEDKNLKSYIRIQSEKNTADGVNFHWGTGAHIPLKSTMDVMQIVETYVVDLLKNLPPNESRLREISMEYCSEIRQSAITAFVIIASIINFQEHTSQETRMDILAESEDIIAHYASDVVVSTNAQTTAAISSSLSAINELNSKSKDPTITNMFFVSQAAQAIVQESMELHRTTPEKEKCAKETKETDMDITITQVVKGGASQPKTTPVKSSSNTRSTSITTTSSSSSAHL
jgi:hypothetical protein